MSRFKVFLFHLCVNTVQAYRNSCAALSQSQVKRTPRIKRHRTKNRRVKNNHIKIIHIMVNCMYWVLPMVLHTVHFMLLMLFTFSICHQSSIECELTVWVPDYGFYSFTTALCVYCVRSRKFSPDDPLWYINDSLKSLPLCLWSLLLWVIYKVKPNKCSKSNYCTDPFDFRVTSYFTNVSCICHSQ